MKLRKMFITVSILAGLFHAGCVCPAPKQAAVSPDDADVSGICAAPEMTTTESQYPVSDSKGRAIQISKLTPKQVVINEPFDYKIKVENLTDQQLQEVVVKDNKPENMTINNSSQEMQVENNQIMWNLGTLQPRETRMITVNAVASETGTINTCAEVQFKSPTCAQIDIIEQQLKLTKNAPENVLRCDRVPLTYTLTNEGSAPACDIVVEDELPEGMMTSKGENSVSFNVDALAPGESKEIEVMVDASSTGQFSSSAKATSRAGGSVTSEPAEVVISQPQLQIRETCPAARYIGSSLTYEISVNNEGNGVAKNTVVAATIPENSEFKKASGGGEYTHSSPGVVTWEIGEIQPGESQNVTMNLQLNEPGTLFTMATARAYCAETVSDSCRTELEGIPAILFEVRDTSDPIRVDGTVTYTITVTNQGSAEDNNIQVSALLEDSMEYVSSSGPTNASVSDSRVNFEPLSTLSENEEATWEVKVRAVSEGDVRFRATLNTEELGRVVMESEATQFYSEQSVPDQRAGQRQFNQGQGNQPRDTGRQNNWQQENQRQNDRRQ